MPADRWTDRDDGLEEERLTSGGERERPIHEEPMIGREGQPNAEEARMEAGKAAPPPDDDMIAGEEIAIFREEVVVRAVPQPAQRQGENDEDEHPPAPPRTPAGGQGTGAPSMH
jgi:hypothetical protein